MTHRTISRVATGLVIAFALVLSLGFFSLTSVEAAAPTASIHVTTASSLPTAVAGKIKSIDAASGTFVVERALSQGDATVTTDGSTRYIISRGFGDLKVGKYVAVYGTTDDGTTTKAQVIVNGRY